MAAYNVSFSTVSHAFRIALDLDFVRIIEVHA